MNLKHRLIMEMKAFDNVEVYIKDILEIDWLYPVQQEILTDFYDPQHHYNEMVVVAGMRSGKTTCVSIPATYEAFKLITLNTPCAHYGLPKGSEIFIINVATSAPQARDTVFAQIKARIDHSPWWQDIDLKERHNEFVIPVQDGKIIIRSEHSNSASLAGHTCKAVILDELARFKETGGKTSAEMVYTTLSRAVKTFGKEGIKISISSPLYVDDYIMQLYRISEKHSNMYARKLATWEMNPNITFEDLRDEFEKNPETAWRDYGAMPSAALEVYFKDPDHIDLCAQQIIPWDVDGRLHLSFTGNPNFLYFLAGDPAFKNDSFGLALIHRENGRVKVDLTHRFAPDVDSEQREVDAKEVKRFILDLYQNRHFNIVVFVTDTWQFPETVQAIRNAGMEVKQNVVDKKEYDYLKELIYTHMIDLPKDPILTGELKSLEITRGVKIGHPRLGSKDVSDAVANAVWEEKQWFADAEVPIAITVKI